MDSQTEPSISPSSSTSTPTNDPITPLAPTKSSVPPLGLARKFLIVWENFTKIEGGDLNNLKSSVNIVVKYTNVTIECMSPLT